MTSRTRSMAGVVLATFVAAPGAANAAELLRGRCHMGTCSWFSVEEKDLVGSSRDGALFKVVLKGWESQHPDGNYARKAQRQGGKAGTSYCFCSKTRPAVLIRTAQGGWQVDDLTLNEPDGPLGPLETTTAIYYAVCHAVAADGPESFVRLARRFGYRTQNDTQQGRPITVPEDILRP